MKAAELMVGNWVLINGTPRKIQAVDGVDDEIMADDELYTLAEDRYHSEDKVEGVPITREILEKNFEKKTFYGIYDDFFDLDIREYSDGIYIVTYHSCEMSIPDQNVLVSWVHELQNFLNHCGIEHDIKL